MRERGGVGKVLWTTTREGGKVRNLFFITFTEARLGPLFLNWVGVLKPVTLPHPQYSGEAMGKKQAVGYV